MPPEESPADQQLKATQKSLDLTFRVMMQIGGLTFGVILLAIIGGVLLDRVLQTKPLFTALLLVGSFPISFYIIYRVAMQAVASLPPPPRPASRPKEDAKSDYNH